jgi:hypothetical protein
MDITCFLQTISWSAINHSINLPNQIDAEFVSWASHSVSYTTSTSYIRKTAVLTLFITEEYIVSRRELDDQQQRVCTDLQEMPSISVRFSDVCFRGRTDKCRRDPKKRSVSNTYHAILLTGLSLQRPECSIPFLSMCK